MYWRDDEADRDDSAAFWRQWVLPRIGDSARVRYLRRYTCTGDLRAANELETRCMLAREVYGVPAAWLDEVIRVRMADLDRDD
jgi:hypothetical protein